MMVAGGMAYARGRNQGEAEEAQSEPAYAESPPPAPPPPAPSDDATSELERLASLHQSGALSDDEFASAKQKVLGA
jgi:multidrug resistance efflux pump